MEMDELIKYAVWIVLFIIALAGIYFLTKRLGII
ncbi:MAG: hypothetical protein UT01_C0062G0008 [Candidatus Daviesbacteria bacterium GW2011_GWA1_38_7]|nr:MAG: hypothetical protein UT01_C0062G0008 [Candidatus Daviesbacteria bacterium GW2011_GWA1_38_7]